MTFMNLGAQYYQTKRRIKVLLKVYYMIKMNSF